MNASGQNNFSFAYTTGQQVGRSLDSLLGYIKDGGIVPPTLFKVSDGGRFAWASIFQSELNHDWETVNRMEACEDAKTQAYGLFSGYADSTGNYICSGNRGYGTALSNAYAHLNNQAVLNKAWPNRTPSAAAMFAEEYDEMYIGTDLHNSPKTADVYIPRFQCSQSFAKFIGDQGRLPQAAELPQGCPAPIITTACVRIFNSSGHFPDGNVFNCSNDANPPEVSVALEWLGSNRVFSYTPLQKTLTKYQENIYMFLNNHDNLQAFDTARIGTIDLAGGNIAGQPFPTEGYGTRLRKKLSCRTVRDSHLGQLATDLHHYSRIRAHD